MRTKVKNPTTPVVAQREPTDAELRALEAQSEDEASEAETQHAPFAAVGSTPIDLARLGLDQIAYVRRSIVDDQPIWSIHSAAGHPLGAAPTFEQAWGAVVQNELVPMYVN
jgi:hypothetical protein